MQLIQSLIYSFLVLISVLFSTNHVFAQSSDSVSSIRVIIQDSTAIQYPVPDVNLGKMANYYIPPPPSRKWWVAGGHAAVWAGTYIALNKAWYDGYERQGFHLFDDGREWNQLDKAGHVWTTYQLGRLSGEVWKWAGLRHNQAVWLGGASAMAFQGIIELQDAYSAKWGFSWWDIAANTVGAAAYVFQELGWKEQRIQIKMGYFPYNYPTELKNRQQELFGAGFAERILKDYNGQTYWLSANLDRFFPSAKLPKWLNLSVGYSSDLMLGGMSNNWTEADGTPVNRNDIARVRRYYISADVDLTRIPTRKKWVRTIFTALNSIKVPAPSLEYNNGGGFRFHWLHQ